MSSNGWKYIEGSYRKGPLKGICRICKSIDNVFDYHPAIRGLKEGDQVQESLCLKCFHRVWAGEN